MYDLIDGELKNGAHFYLLRIHYEDTDISGVVYHAQYLAFMERARSSLIRLIDFPSENFLQKGLNLVVNKANIHWSYPLKLGSKVCVKTTLDNIKRASLTLNQIIYHEDCNNVSASALIKICILNNEGKVIKIPENFKNTICLSLA